VSNTEYFKAKLIEASTSIYKKNVKINKSFAKKPVLQSIDKYIPQE